MKQLILTLMVALMSVMASTPAAAKSSKNELKKQGMNCEVYSPCSADDYSVSDASKIKSTNFEVVDKVEGKLYKKASVGEVTRIIKKLVNQYL